jgi:hypothetical protein
MGGADELVEVVRRAVPIHVVQNLSSGPGALRELLPSYSSCLSSLKDGSTETRKVIRGLGVEEPVVSSCSSSICSLGSLLSGTVVAAIDLPAAGTDYLLCSVPTLDDAILTTLKDGLALQENDSSHLVVSSWHVEEQKREA